MIRINFGACRRKFGISVAPNQGNPGDITGRQSGGDANDLLAKTTDKLVTLTGYRSYRPVRSHPGAAAEQYSAPAGQRQPGW
jgi:hypothetical protein